LSSDVATSDEEPHFANSLDCGEIELNYIAETAKDSFIVGTIAERLLVRDSKYSDVFAAKRTASHIDYSKRIPYQSHEVATMETSVSE
jgi:hypothetical protein